MRDITVTLGLKDLEDMIETAYLRGIDVRYDSSVPEDYQLSNIKQ